MQRCAISDSIVGHSNLFRPFQLSITVILYKTVVQHIFLGSVILLVSLNYVNMGCAIDMHLIKETIKKPIGPVIGLLTQFGAMPTVCTH